MVTCGRRGLVATLNHGLALARAEFIARMDADDIALPERFAAQHRHMVEHPTLLVLGTAAGTIENGKVRKARSAVVGAAEVARTLQRACCIAHPTVMMRRQPILEFGGYRPAYAHAEDYDLWLRASERGMIDNLAITGVYRRLHPGRVSRLHAVRQQMSAELARATHRRRAAGASDPTEAVPEPIELADPLLDELLGERASLYRALDAALGDGLHCAPRDELLEVLLAGRIEKHQRGVVQRALVRVIRNRPRLDRVGLRALVRAACINPSRFARQMASES
jgi:hypothetical protein